MAPHNKNAEEHPTLRSAKALTQGLTTTGEQLNATSADFLKIDVETGLTFSGLALETDNKEKKERNRKNAREAFNTILRFWDNVDFSPHDEAYIHEKMGQLKSDLELLGEKF